MGCISSLQYILQIPEDSGLGYATAVVGTPAEEQIAEEIAA
jgi:hypothetical protein